VLARGPVGTLPMQYCDWLECCLLYREAKTLIDGAPPADDPRWHVARALAFLALADQKKATESYAKAVELEAVAFPKEPGGRDSLARGHYNLAEQFQKLGQSKEAAKAFRHAITVWEKLADDLPTKPEYRRHRA